MCVSSAPGAAAELVEDVPGLELGVCPFAEDAPDPLGLLVGMSAFPQVGQDQQGLPGRIQLPPPRPNRLQVPADQRDGEVEGPGRQRQRGTVEKSMRKPL